MNKSHEVLYEKYVHLGETLNEPYYNYNVKFKPIADRGSAGYHQEIIDFEKSVKNPYPHLTMLWRSYGNVEWRHKGILHNLDGPAMIKSIAPTGAFSNPPGPYTGQQPVEIDWDKGKKFYYINGRNMGYNYWKAITDHLRKSSEQAGFNVDI